MLSEEIITKISFSLQDVFEKMGWGNISVLPHTFVEVRMLKSFPYNGKVNLFGDFEGFVGISLQESLVRKLIPSSKKNSTDEYLLNVATEITNIISGNLKSLLGSEVEISVPEAFKGDFIKIIQLEHYRVCEIPIEFKQNLGKIVVHLRKV